MEMTSEVFGNFWKKLKFDPKGKGGTKGIHIFICKIFIVKFSILNAYILISERSIAYCLVTPLKCLRTAKGGPRAFMQNFHFKIFDSKRYFLISERFSSDTFEVFGNFWKKIKFDPKCKGHLYWVYMQNFHVKFSILNAYNHMKQNDLSIDESINHHFTFLLINEITPKQKNIYIGPSNTPRINNKITTHKHVQTWQKRACEHYSFYFSNVICVRVCSEIREIICSMIFGLY
jgi:hypothetical protein